MALDLHCYVVEVEGDCYPRVSVLCPYDRADRERPCWARNEDGTLDEGLAMDCNHEAWIGNIGWEMVEGSRRFQLAGARLDWSNGDYPVLRIDFDRKHRIAVAAALRELDIG